MHRTADWVVLNSRVNWNFVPIHPTSNSYPDSATLPIEIILGDEGMGQGAGIATRGYNSYSS